jgi:hypothetical protein
MDGQEPGKTERHMLPTRRLTETRKVEIETGQTVFLSVGYDPDQPTKPIEVFYSSGFKSGVQLEFQVQDFCILFSLLLQYGMTPAEVAKSLARNEMPDGSLEYASISGAIVAELISPPSWATDA